MSRLGCGASVSGNTRRRFAIMKSMARSCRPDGGGSEGARRRGSRASAEDVDGDRRLCRRARGVPASPRRSSSRRGLRRRRRRAPPATVMFCDLVGSTALSARLDPEDMRQIIRAYQDACSGVVARYDGFVAKFFGDGILAYFGFPRAHEDDAARAVHAGLEIAEVVAGLQTRAREKLAVRVGIATGLVVVGDLVGQGSAQEQAVVGDTPNLAARLQGLADAGGVVVAAATRRLLGDRFRLRIRASTPSRASPSRSRRGRRSACRRARAASRPRMPRGSPASSGARPRAPSCSRGSAAPGRATARSC